MEKKKLLRIVLIVLKAAIAAIEEILGEGSAESKGMTPYQEAQLKLSREANKIAERNTQANERSNRISGRNSWLVGLGAMAGWTTAIVAFSNLVDDGATLKAILSILRDAIEVMRQVLGAG